MTTAWAEFERYEQRVYKEGYEEGRMEDQRDGERLGLSKAVLDLCEVLDIPVSAERRGQIQQMDLPALEQLRAHLKQHRAWPRE